MVSCRPSTSLEESAAPGRAEFGQNLGQGQLLVRGDDPSRALRRDRRGTGSCDLSRGRTTTLTPGVRYSATFASDVAPAIGRRADLEDQFRYDREIARRQRSRRHPADNCKNATSAPRTVSGSRSVLHARIVANQMTRGRAHRGRRPRIRTNLAADLRRAEESARSVQHDPSRAPAPSACRHPAGGRNSFRGQ